MTEANKKLVRDYFEQAWNQHNPAAVDKFMAPGYANDGRLPGVSPDAAGLKQWMGSVFQAFPDLEWTVEDVMAEGNQVAVRWTAKGSHQGEFMGIPATGQQVSVRGFSLEEVEGGKIRRSWSEWDALGLLQQMGVIPEAA